MVVVLEIFGKCRNDQTGPDHDKTFVVAAYLGREKTALGEGRSKQEAEQQAAENALRAKGW